MSSKGFAILIICFLLVNNGSSQSLPLSVSVGVRDSLNSRLLILGIHPDATNGIDHWLGEAELPPLPPMGTLDVRFIGVDSTLPLGGGVLTDYRRGQSHLPTETTHYISFQIGNGSFFMFSWDFPDSVSATLHDEATGWLLNRELRNSGEMKLVNASLFSLLKLVIRYNWVKAKAKLFLQGPYDRNAERMQTHLMNNRILASRFQGHVIPTNTVDSIGIEIGNSAMFSSATIRTFRPAWLISDGTIRDFKDTVRAYLEFDVPVGDYYIRVYHRNHLSIMSRTLIPLLKTEGTSHDFTLSKNQAYGTNAMILVGGSYCLIAGDSDESGDVNALDRTATWNGRNLSGYQNMDTDLSGDVSALDRTMTWNNRNLSTQVPGEVPASRSHNRKPF